MFASTLKSLFDNFTITKDIIIKIDNITLEKMSDLRKYIYTKNVGDEVILRIQRNNVEKEVKMMLTRK